MPMSRDGNGPGCPCPPDAGCCGAGSILGAKNLTVRYNGHVAVNNISFDVGEGDLLGIVGPNGAGKTTLFRAILGLQPYEGEIAMFGHGADKFGSLIPLIGYVPQKITFEQNFPATVHDVVSMGVIPRRASADGAGLIRRGGFRRNRAGGRGGRRGMVEEALRTVGLRHLRDRRIGELSGGEQQRVFIAKSLVKDPVLMILDEPVTGVDSESQARFYGLIKRLNEEDGITIIWSSHDLDAIESYASRVACMNRALFFHGNKERFFADKEALGAYAESAMQEHMHDHRVAG